LGEAPQAIVNVLPAGEDVARPLEHVRMKALRLGASLTEGDDSVGLVEKLLAGPSSAAVPKPPAVPAPPTAPPPVAPPAGAAPEVPGRQSRLPWVLLPWLGLCAGLVPRRARSRQEETDRDAGR
jgi:hypothetical protein